MWFCLQFEPLGKMNKLDLMSLCCGFAFEHTVFPFYLPTETHSFDILEAIFLVLVCWETRAGEGGRE